MDAAKREELPDSTTTSSADRNCRGWGDGSGVVFPELEGRVLRTGLVAFLD